MKTNFIEFDAGVISHSSQVQSVNVYPYLCIIRDGNALLDCDDMFINQFADDVRKDIRDAILELAKTLSHKAITVPLLHEIFDGFVKIQSELRAKHPRYDMVVKRYEI